MRSIRKIHVTHVLKSVQWKQIAADALKNFTFEFPRESYNVKDTEQRDKCEIKFILDCEETAVANVPGSDPFKRPHLRLYIIDTPGNKDIDAVIQENILHWTSKCQFAQNNFGVIIIQEQTSIFTTYAQINKTNLVPDESFEDNVMILQANEKHTEQYCEKIRQFLVKLIFEDSKAYFKRLDAEQNYVKDKFLPNERWRLVKSLSLAAIGFLISPLNSIIDIYNKLLQNETFDFDELVSKPIDQKVLPHYPNIENAKTNAELVMVCLHCILNISSTHVSNSAAAKVIFYKHYSFLRSLCKTDEDEGKLNNWAETSIVAITGLFSDDFDFKFRLYQSLFVIYDSNDLEKLFSIKDFVLGEIEIESRKINSRNGFATRIATAALETANTFTPPKNIYVGWNADTKFLDLYSRKLLSEKDPNARKYLAQIFSNRSVFPMKEQLLQELMKTGEEFSFDHQDFYKIKLESDIFRGKSDCDRPFNLQLFVEQVDWLPKIYSHIDLIFQHMRTEKTITFPTQYVSIGKPIDILVHFNLPGKWIPLALKFYVGNICFIHNLQLTHINIAADVNARSEPPIQIKLCTISSVLPEYFVEFYINFKNCASQSIYLNIRSTDSIIDALKGIVEINSIKYEYDISSDGIINFIDPKNDCSIPLSLSDVRFTLPIKPKPGSNICQFSLVSSIENNVFETKFSQAVEFPIQVSTRIFTKSIVHTCLTNTGPNDVTLVEGKLDHSIYNNLVIKPGKSTYLMSHCNGEKDIEFKACFYEAGAGFPTVEKSWSILSTMTPNVNVSYSPSHPHAGASIKVNFTLPKCTFQVLTCPHFVVSGITKRNNFEGGEVSLNLIPQTPGVLKLPILLIDGVETTMLPSAITVTEGEILTSCPFVLK